MCFIFFAENNTTSLDIYYNVGFFLQRKGMYLNYNVFGQQNIVIMFIKFSRKYSMHNSKCCVNVK